MRNPSTYRAARKADAKKAGFEWRESTDKYTHGKLRYRRPRLIGEMPHQGTRECARRRGQMAKAEGKRAAEAARLAAAMKKPRKPRARKVVAEVA